MGSESEMMTQPDGVTLHCIALLEIAIYIMNPICVSAF